MTQFILVLVLATLSPITLATSLDLRGYAGPRGEIRTHLEGDVVDPYFATKALLEARAAGLEIDAPALAWIKWALEKQLPNGLFQRYCRTSATGWDWKACAAADADDAMLAVWLHLLAHLWSPQHASHWQRSVDLAWTQLETLRDPQSGIYHISRQQPVGLFADNIEVYAALRALARMNERSGKLVRARQLARLADRLQSNIAKAFWDQRTRRFRASTQARTEHAFYPDEVAQVYPWLLEPGAPEKGGFGFSDAAAYAEWITRNGSDWLNLKADNYPWGLVALASSRFGDHASASCWLQIATPLRHGKRWNVLEEVALQAVQVSRPPGTPDPVNCPPTLK